MTKSLANYSIGPVNTLSPTEESYQKYVVVENGKIKEICNKNPGTDFWIRIDNPNMILMPGFINGHDHLQGAYWPKVDTDKPWVDVFEWLKYYDIDPIKFERRKVTNGQIYQLGAYKNLIAGTSTVMDHYPHVVTQKWPVSGNEEFIDDLPIRVLREYTLAHEIHSQEAPWGDEWETEHKWAVERDWPFVTHIEEGFTPECFLGIDFLKERNMLDEHTVMVHCIAFSDQDIEDVADAKAHVVICPGSNFFMFNKTSKIKEMLDKGINLSLGTDSPITGSMNILAEMKFLSRIFQDMYKIKLDPKTIVEMTTTNVAKALRIEDKIGKIEPGYSADMLLFNPTQKNPYQAVVDMELEHIQLVTLNGNPLIGNPKYKEMFNIAEKEFNLAKLNSSERLIVGDIKGLLRKIRKQLGYVKPIPFLPIS